MSKNHQSWSRQQFLKIGAFIIIALLLLARIGYGQTQVKEGKSVILQGSIQIQPTKLLPENQGNQIQPGTTVKIMVTVENKGEQESSPGLLYVRYAFAHPLDDERSSIIFETEKKPLPSIEPGHTINVAFDTPHEIPSLLDFVRDDWSIREYQAIAVVNQREYLIGSLALTFSAYYYPGIKKEFPTKIPSGAVQK